MENFTVEDIRENLNTAITDHLKEINMTPFSVFEISGRAILYLSLLVKHYNWDDTGLSMLQNMAKTISVPGMILKEDPTKKGN